MNLPQQDEMAAVAAVPRKGFWRWIGAFVLALLSDRHGVPDEGAAMFVLGCLVLTGAAVVHPKDFPFLEYAGALVALIPLYKAARGDFRRP